MATNGFAANIVSQFSYSVSGNAGANSIFMSRVTVIRTATVSAVLQNIGTGISGIQYKAVIYDGTPSVLLATGSLVTSVVAGYNRFQLTAPVVLGPGTYYVGYVTNSGVQVSTSSGSTSWFVSGGQSVTSPANPLVGGSSNSTGLVVALEFDGSTAADYGFAPDYTAGLTLSSSSTIATTTSSGSQSARSVITHNAVVGGKYYAEVAISGSASKIGLISAFAPIADGGSTNYMITEALLSSGQATGSASGGNYSTGISYASGDVVGIAYDAMTGLLWFNKNGGAWGGSTTSGNPATGSNGIPMPIGNWPFMVTVGSIGAVAAFTLRDRAGAQQYSPPSGFVAWSPAAMPTAARQYAVSVNS